jgi:mannitol-1-phosphate 5-dehydrogenase
VVIGAGKIARGFIGHLLYMSGFETVFVDVDASLVALINQRSRYSVHVLGHPAKDALVDGISALQADDPEVQAVINSSRLVFVSVGGNNLPSVGRLLAPALIRRAEARGAPLNIVVCENWRGAARVLGASIEEALDEAGVAELSGSYGIAESTVLRSCIEPTSLQRAKDPLAVQVQDYWTLDIDADPLVAKLPDIMGVHPVTGFTNALERKIYTYNMTNAVISYLGYVSGFDTLAEAARDPRILAVVEEANQQVGQALCHAHGYQRAEQEAYAAVALAKFQDPTIADPIARQVRDPLRKLSRFDRLVGPAMLCLDLAITPSGVALAIAAAMRYDSPNDASAVELQRRVRECGEKAALAEIADLPESSELIALVASQQSRLTALVSP